MTRRVTAPDQLGLGLGEVAAPSPPIPIKSRQPLGPEEDFDRERGFRCEGCGHAKANELRIVKLDPGQRTQLPAILLCDFCLPHHYRGELLLPAEAS